jgi:TrmH family RNA methyltransferase
MNEPKSITSRDNAKIKFVRRVRDGKEPDAIFIEGVRLAEEALRSGVQIAEAFVTPRFAADQRKSTLVDELRKRGIQITEVSAGVFGSIADTENSQAIVLIAERPENGAAAIEANLNGKSRIVLFLFEINNPANLGAIFRTAEAAGVAGVIVSSGSADPFSPKALRAAMGSSFRLPIWEVADLATVLEWGSENGLISTAADINAAAAAAYTRIDWKKPRLLIFGSEAHGLDKSTLDKVDELTFIPMQNSVESLNLAVSAGIILFEAQRQNRNPIV